jgi:GAF domain-containing protein
MSQHTSTNESDLAAAGEVRDLATLLSEAARSWESEGSVQDTLQAIAMSAVDTVPGADYAGVSLVQAPRTITTPAATDDLVRDADAVQSSLGEGPCVDAVWERRTVRVDDLGADSRWPLFGPRAAALGVRSMLAFRLFTEEHSWGALNLYSRRPHAFGEGAEFVGQLFASHASIALAGSQEIAQLNEALATRDLIGLAKGILVERHKISPEAAFGMLVATSHSSKMKLAEVAAWLVRAAAATDTKTDPKTESGTRTKTDPKTASRTGPKTHAENEE